MRKPLLWLGAFAVLTLGVACSDTSDPSAEEGPGEATPAHGSGGTGELGGSSGPGGGTATTDGGASVSSNGVPCAVDAILEKNCRTCHGATTAYGAPFALVTHDDVVPRKDRVLARIKDAQRPMPPAPNEKVSEADVKTLEDWFNAGAPRSEEACSSIPGGRGGDVKPLSCNVNQKMRPAAKYTVPKDAKDTYVCYGLDVKPAKKEHLIALAPHIANKNVVHHLLLFQTPSAYSTTPTACSAAASTSWRLIAGWAPGGTNFELPPEAGFPQEGDTHYVLQIHYNNAKGAVGEVDDSGYDMCTTTTLRPNDADIMATGSVSLNLPPRATTEVTCEWKPGRYGAFTVFGVNPHMHQLGTALSTYKLAGGANGAATKLVDVAFDFESQASYGASVKVEANDVLRTKCVYNNTTSSAVRFGEGTGDEMCFSFLTYYPKIKTNGFSWTTPSTAALFGGCKSTTK